MKHEKRSKWSSQATFILAAIGSAVGLGNAWRFPGLAAKHGGGTYLLIYLVALFVVGIPLLMMEVSVARKFHRGAGESMRGINKKTEFIGWAATSNAFVISTYYAVVFAWVILMTVCSVKFAGMTGDVNAAQNLFADLTQTTWDIKGFSIPIPVLLSVIVAWAAIYYCIRNGASSVGKVVKYTVFLPVILLVIMAIKGCTMPGAGEGLRMFFIPSMSAFEDPSLWIDAIGQVFYSLSIMMAIMFAYGSYLGESANVAKDCVIIALSDAAGSVLSGIVMFSTMGGVGMLDSITDSGIATAFIVYPQAIVNLTDIGWFNALFGAIFYLMLVTLAIDSAFSIIEGVSASVADKFHLNPKKVTRWACVISAIISLLYATRAGVAWLDIVDNWTNQINLIVIGILECIAVGWCFQIDKVWQQINRNTKKFKMPRMWIRLAIRYIAPATLLILFVWNLYVLFAREHMTADEEEIQQAVEEGIMIHPAQTFERITGTGHVTGVDFMNVKSFTFDENHRAVIHREENSEHHIEADTVIFAVGQRPDITEEAGLALGRGNSIAVRDIETDKATSVDGIFAAGDAIYGTKSVIMAIESGREAAAQIDQYLGGNGDISEKLAPEQKPDAYIGICEGFGYMQRKNRCIDSPESRCNNFELFDLGICDSDICAEAGRCLLCDL